jgi:hypothetical protein
MGVSAVAVADPDVPGAPQALSEKVKQSGRAAVRKSCMSDVPPEEV